MGWFFTFVPPPKIPKLKNQKFVFAKCCALLKHIFWNKLDQNPLEIECVGLIFWIFWVIFGVFSPQKIARRKNQKSASLKFSVLLKHTFTTKAGKIGEKLKDYIHFFRLFWVIFWVFSPQKIPKIENKKTVPNVFWASLKHTF